MKGGGDGRGMKWGGGGGGGMKDVRKGGEGKGEEEEITHLEAVASALNRCEMGE